VTGWSVVLVGYAAMALVWVLLALRARSRP
jgi:hypothetical protein